ncbi:MAG: alcohol dehydrogenase [Frankiaceae bacterium]|nr:alcohol dehydrogenase [Frankiaceae bacterium]
MTTVNAYASFAADQPLAPTTIERREVGPHDVLIDIKFAGICHSDIHTARAEWGEPTNRPIVVGHEIAGIVSEVGSEVSKHKVGDRVGVGCMVNSCRECENCQAGMEQYCLKGMTGTYDAIDVDGNPTAGGYSTAIVVTEDFVLRIPEGIELDAAAPLLCAGVTLFSPLARFGAGPGKKVAIIGLGGLGHMGVKIAAAMGAEVTVLSQSLKKQEDGLRLGAQSYYATSDDETFASLKGSFDLIVNTVSANLPMDSYLGLLKAEGTLVEVGAPEKPMPISAFSLIGGGKTLAGSMIGGIAQTQEMLDFCAEHHLGAEIEVIGADKIDEAWERVVASDVRYRFVIDTSTFDN